jgi:hypothetical protein
MPEARNREQFSDALHTTDDACFQPAQMVAHWSVLLPRRLTAELW